MVKYNPDKIFNDNKLPNSDSITVNRNPNSDNEVSNKNYIDDELDKNTIVRFNQTLENYLKVSVGNEVSNPTKNGKIQLTDTTEIVYPNIGSDKLQQWIVKSVDRNGSRKIWNFIKSRIKNSPTRNTGAIFLPLIGIKSMYIATSSVNYGAKKFVVGNEQILYKIQI